MRYFVLLDLQHLVLALFLGLIAVLFVYVAWRGYPAPDKGQPDAKDPLSPAHEKKSPPLPPILIFIFVGASLWALGYALVRGIWGGPIG